jgi:ABC-type lipoprotein export system ATPase subunit
MAIMTSERVLEIRDLRFRYAASDLAEGWTIDIQSLDLARGEQMLLRGGSGRGKSTLLQLIAGLMEPAGGAVIIDGTAIQGLGGAARDRFRGEHIGMIFQTFNLLFGFSAIENVMMALMFSRLPQRDHRARAAALLKHLGIDRVDRDVTRLSVGQQQRVAVARAVACDPALVLADEPTASLDPDNAAAAIELIQSACRERGAALLCVSHDPAMAERFARVEDLEALRAARPQPT